MTSHQNQKLIKENIVPIVIGAIILLLSATIFRSSIINFIKLNKTNRDLDKRLGNLTIKMELLQSLDQTEVEERVLKLEEVFPSQKPVLTLLAALNQLAVSEGVTFSGLSLNPGPIEKKTEDQTKKATSAKQKAPASSTTLSDFNIEFSINGDLNRVTSFISHLEKIAPILRIESIGLSLGGEAILGVKVFYQPLPATLGSIDQPVPVLPDKDKALLEEVMTYTKVPLIKATSATGKDDPFTPL